MRRAGLLAALLVTAACGSGGAGPKGVPMTISLSSPAFPDGGAIPRAYTCDGSDVSPPLLFADVPSGAAELALLVEDPDAPGGTFVHWVAWGIDPSEPTLSEDAAPPGAGRNGFGRDGYGGPCPPAGRPHRYVFTVYAVGQHLDLPPGASADELRDAIAGHVLAEGTLTGTYGR